MKEDIEFEYDKLNVVIEDGFATVKRGETLIIDIEGLGEYEIKKRVISVCFNLEEKYIKD